MKDSKGCTIGQTSFAKQTTGLILLPVTTTWRLTRFGCRTLTCAGLASVRSAARLVAADEADVSPKVLAPVVSRTTAARCRERSHCTSHSGA